MAYDFINAVLGRPEMYTMTGSYPEVVAFLEGYYSGLAKSEQGLGEAAKWSSFRQWLCRKFSVSSSNEFQELFTRFEGDSLRVFDELYREFKTVQE
jgi:hypothetical protein